MAQIPVCSTVQAADTDSTSLSVTRDCEPTAASQWLFMEPNEIGNFSPEIGTVARDPISLDRQNRKGTITSLTASPEFTADTVQEMMGYFGDAFLYSTWKGASPTGLDVTAATATGYAVTAGGDLAEGTLIYVTGFPTPENNGLKVVGAASTSTDIVVAGTVAETAPAGARLRTAGVQCTSGDLTVNADGNLTSTVLDFTTLDLTVGQFVHVGGESTASKFAVADNYGLARIESISENLLEIGQTEQPFTVDAGTGQTVQLLFQSFVRNVSVDDPDFQRVRHTMEARYNTAPVTYEYAREAYCNTLELSFPSEDKSTMSLGFIAKDIEAPVTARKDGAAWNNQALTEAFNTASDFMRLRVADIDGNGVTSYFKDTTINIDNGAQPETVLGSLTAAFVNLSNFTVTLDTEAVMTDGAVLAAIRNNTTVSLQASLRNNEGGFVVDLPAMTLGDGSKNLSRNEKVKVTISANCFKDDILGYTMGISLFAWLPPAE